ncbi:RidA family protein [Gemmatimonas sp.]|jgi:2-iminobutanoate/2-iminopropanoate deaminase|uniref:RidA family protein n=1 Tax=Gemmatimonas sp. TaxID=1962908 RepID=UPI0037BF9F1A
MHSTRRSTAFAPMAALFSVLALSSASSAQAQAAGRQTVVGEGQRISATLSPGIRVGNLLWASGQLGTSPTDTTIAGQTTRALESTEKVFKAAGTTLAAAATKCTVFLTDVKDFQGMNGAYTKFFPSNPPARSTVVIAALVVPGAKVEIECQGVIPQ